MSSRALSVAASTNSSSSSLAAEAMAEMHYFIANSLPWAVMVNSRQEADGGVRVMNDATAIVIGGLIGIIASATGSLIILFGERALRTSGEIKLRTSRWELKPAKDDPATHTYKLSIFAFNDMEINTAARDVRVVFVKQGKQPMVSTPKDAVSNYRIDALDFPSRSPITRDVRGKVATELLEERFGEPLEEKSIDKVELTGFWPTGVEIVHTVRTNGETNERQCSYKQWRSRWYRRIV
jgi:hypothetical protein